ncbi:DNA-directed RNA polymerase III subunit RPC4-like [Anoplophora glabripennis]|uniref:DNA-directed RNA polymerase III subunit RPC4-like n=1 Tax=Anoplophora glabripennis TaxID=217634 RepID=UPI0008756AD5|nr:DNA-directed RNA polymerase III subunit RPC4-like [Anoplophora glabripennis]
METKKLNKFDVKDFIKENSGGPRLQSLRLPRDLSLGGSKLPKKIYKPNLNVVRNKEKTKEVSKRDKAARENRQSQNIQKHRFVQSTGVFSEGIGDLNRIPEKKVYVKDVEKPHINVNKTPPVPKEAEKEIPNYLFKFDEASDEDDSKESNPAFAPINWNSQDLLKETLKDEVKNELTDFSSNFQCQNTNQEISNKNPTVTLWQLPDSLGMQSKTEKKVVDCKLTDLPEGKIGKLCVRRSGKLDVYIGSIKYELEPSELETFTEDVVSINVENTDGSVATVLNKIQNRFLLNPSWHSLLK